MRERPSSSSAVRRYLRVAAPPDDSLPELDGESPEMSTLKQHIRCVARDGDVTVLIVGESGTGKELVARAIHRTSRRHRAPFVVVNCAGLSPTLVEDELFGHVRGAFTGAVFDKAGPFERATSRSIHCGFLRSATAERRTYERW
ncbi:MAG: sigma-54 factor interaction domain-containing protein [Acidobacteria bacterium]|nr:sigma-54 factor interaction domain-containing protein [Acidobacteriota bacterium]